MTLRNRELDRIIQWGGFLQNIKGHTQEDHKLFTKIVVYREKIPLRKRGVDGNG